MGESFKQERTAQIHQNYESMDREQGWSTLFSLSDHSRWRDGPTFGRCLCCYKEAKGALPSCLSGRLCRITIFDDCGWIFLKGVERKWLRPMPTSSQSVMLHQIQPLNESTNPQEETAQSPHQSHFPAPARLKPSLVTATRCTQTHTNFGAETGRKTNSPK